MQYIFSAGFILYCVKDGVRKFLLLQYIGKYWDLPKGKIEKGETKEEAALRELKEETGLTAKIIPGFQTDLEYFFKQKGVLHRKTVYFFIGETDSEDVTLSDEHIGYTWLPYEEAVEKLTYANAKKVMQQAQNFLD